MRAVPVPAPTIGPALRTYLAEHADIVTRDGYGAPRLWRTNKPLPVFKNAGTGKSHRNVIYAIINMVIPTDTLLHTMRDFDASHCYTMSWRKMRAERADVHSIATLDGKPCEDAYSLWANNFLYKPGWRMKPTRGFSHDFAACDSGIHFYLNVDDAIRGIM